MLCPRFSRGECVGKAVLFHEYFYTQFFVLKVWLTFFRACAWVVAKRFLLEVGQASHRYAELAVRTIATILTLSHGSKSWKSIFLCVASEYFPSLAVPLVAYHHRVAVMWMLLTYCVSWTRWILRSRALHKMLRRSRFHLHTHCPSGWGSKDFRRCEVFVLVISEPYCADWAPDALYSECPHSESAGTRLCPTFQSSCQLFQTPIRSWERPGRTPTCPVIRRWARPLIFAHLTSLSGSSNETNDFRLVLSRHTVNSKARLRG